MNVRADVIAGTGRLIVSFQLRFRGTMISGSFQFVKFAGHESLVNFLLVVLLLLLVSDMLLLLRFLIRTGTGGIARTVSRSIITPN